MLTAINTAASTAGLSTSVETILVFGVGLTIAFTAYKLIKRAFKGA